MLVFWFGTHVLGEVVDVHTRFTGLRFVVVDTHHHAARIDKVHAAATARQQRPYRSPSPRCASMPVPTNGLSARKHGTAWRCMFEPINARFASSCSRNGINEAATETICAGAMSMYSILSGPDNMNSFGCEMR